MITLKFSNTFQDALCKRVAAHQEAIDSTLKVGVDETYAYIVAALLEHHKLAGSWKGWLCGQLLKMQLLYGYKGETLGKGEIEEFIKSSTTYWFSDYDDLNEYIDSRAKAYRKLKHSKHYRKALMLLRYCSSFETVTVPMDFLVWFEQ